MKSATNTVEGPLKDEGRQLRKVKSSVKQPLPNGYHIVLEQSDEFILELASRCLQLIGILRCILELRRIDIFTEVEVMSQ